MRTAALALVLVSVLIAGCGPRTVGVSSDTELAAMNEEIRGHRVTLFLADNTRVACDQAVVMRDTCICELSTVERPVRIPTRHVVAVKLGRPWRGVGWGFVIGAAAGGLVGVAADAPSSDAFLSAYSSWVTSIVYAAIGSAIGLVAGPCFAWDRFEIDIDNEGAALPCSGEAHGVVGERARATPPN
jgi:hypothetical protein